MNGEWVKKILELLEKEQFTEKRLEEAEEIIRKGKKIMKKLEKDKKKMVRKDYYEKWLAKKLGKIEILDEDERNQATEREWIEKLKETIPEFLALLKAKKLEMKDLKSQVEYLQRDLIFEREMLNWYKEYQEWFWKNIAEIFTLNNSNHWLKVELNLERRSGERQMQIIKNLEIELEEVKNSRARTIIISVLVTTGVVAVVIKFFYWIKNSKQKQKKF